MMRALIVTAVIAAVIAAAATAHASTRRIAVIVGNNAGNADKVPLHFAETDAARFAQVLGELGDVAPGDLFVLQGKSLAALTETFARVRRQITGLRVDPANHVIVLFYFSGHSDGEALELGRDRLTFSELRRGLASLGADVRVALIDSCKSGALLEAKGGKPGPGFQIRMTDELASTGEALLTSSAADEVALESREIGGSFFTHHLISGLRGAADTSGDGLVTLTEAYQYAYAHTIKATGETVIAMQHPAYDYRLSGQGELVLSEIGKRTARIELPGGFDRILVIELGRDEVTAEVASDTHVPIAVHAGRYAIRASRDGKLFAGQVAVASGSLRTVRAEELTPSALAATASKGAADPDAGLPASLVLAGGGGSGIASGLGVVPGLRVDLVVPTGGSIAVDIGSRAGTGFRETSMRAFAGYRRTLSGAAWSTWAGLELGGGAVLQSSSGKLAYSGMLAGGAAAGGALRVARTLAIAIETTVPVEVLKRDGKTAWIVAPAAWLGLVVPL